MDAEGNCLVVSPCNACRTSKNGVQACISRKHNARLTSVKKTDLTSRHRQCVKPDQAMTIFKLVDRESGEESVEFAAQMVFQRPCDLCQGLKSCIFAGHTLKDWSTDGAYVTRPNKRKSLPSGKSPKPSPTLTSGELKPGAGVSPPFSASIPGPVPAPIPGTVFGSTTAASSFPKPVVHQAHTQQNQSKRRKVEGWSALLPDHSRPAVAPSGVRSGGGGGGGRGRGRDGGQSSTQTIATQLQTMAASEDVLIHQYQTEMRRLDQVEAAKMAQIQRAEAELESIRLARKTMKDSTAEKRKKMAVNRQRLTQLRLQEVIREEEKLRREKEALWSACEVTTTCATGERPGMAAAPGRAMSLAVKGELGIGSASAVSPRVANAAALSGAPGSLLNGSPHPVPGRAGMDGVGGGSGSARGFCGGSSSFLRGGDNSDGDVDPGTEVDVGGVDERYGGGDSRGGGVCSSVAGVSMEAGVRGANERRDAASRANGWRGAGEKPSEASSPRVSHANGTGSAQPEDGAKGDRASCSPTAGSPIAGVDATGGGLGGPRGEERAAGGTRGGDDSEHGGGDSDEEMPSAASEVVPSGDKEGRHESDSEKDGEVEERDKGGARTAPRRPEGGCAPRHGGVTPEQPTCLAAKAVSATALGKDAAVERECAQNEGGAVGGSGGGSSADEVGGTCAASVKINGGSKMAETRGRTGGVPSERAGGDMAR